MQFKYLGEVPLSGTQKAVVDQQEVWTLNAIIDYAKQDLEQAASLFGSSKEVFLDRLKKHKLISQFNKFCPDLSLDKLDDLLA